MGGEGACLASLLFRGKDGEAGERAAIWRGKGEDTKGVARYGLLCRSFAHGNKEKPTILRRRALAPTVQRLRLANHGTKSRKVSGRLLDVGAMCSTMSCTVAAGRSRLAPDAEPCDVVASNESD